MKDRAKGGTDPIEPDKFINIWITKLPPDIGSYSTSPYQSNELAGIVIDHDYFGDTGTDDSPYGQGRTLTHLIGNYLGLRDLWNLYEPCTDDLVSDTPIHNSPNNGCHSYKHFSSCGEAPIAMTMNFMDSTDDACQVMFTRGQVQRIHAIIKVARPGLLSRSIVIK